MNHSRLIVDRLASADNDAGSWEILLFEMIKDRSREHSPRSDGRVSN